MKTKPLVVSDWDGTLFNSLDLIHRAVREVFRASGFSEDKIPTYLEWFFGGKPPWFDWYRSYGVKFSEKEIYRILLSYQLRHYNQCQLYPNARECISGLVKAGFQVGLVTAQDIRHLLPIIEREGLGGFFKPGVNALGRETHPCKVTNIGNVRYRLASSTVVHLGDSVSDTRDAQIAGAEAIAMCHGDSQGLYSEVHLRAGAKRAFPDLHAFHTWMNVEFGEL